MSKMKDDSWKLEKTLWSKERGWKDKGTKSLKMWMICYINVQIS